MRIRHNIADDGDDTEVEARRHLLAALEAQMGGYKTTLKQDLTALQQGAAAMPFRRRMIRKFMAGEKAILKGVIEQLGREVGEGKKDEL